jgi:thiol-disulfide isomerase/thioredoxin
LTTAKETALNQLTSRRLILQAAARQGFVLEETVIQKQVDLLFGGYGDEALDEALRLGGATREDLLWWVSEITTAEEYVIQVIMAGVDPDARRQAYNDWLNTQQAAANIQIFSDGAAESFAAAIGNPAPDFTLTTLDGRSVSLSDYADRVVLVNFWATWCPSCVGQMPEYEQVYQRYGQPAGDGQLVSDFVILGVNLQEEPDWVKEFTSSLGLTYPILLDKDGSVTGRQYQVSGMPASILIDRQGIIVYRHIGPMSGDFLTAKLAEVGF